MKRLGLCVVVPFLFTAADSVSPRKVILPQHVADDFAAKCLDSSPAGYYLREQDPQKWIIMIDGGGICIDAIDCRKRARTTLGSSKSWPSQWDPEAVPFTGGSAFFSDFSQVLVPYCSGDVWLGQDRQKRLLVGDLQMSGHLILNAIVEHLVNSTMLRSSSLVVFAGASAGGIGVFHHGDWIASKLKSMNVAPRVVLLPIAGLFFPQKWPVLWPAFRLGFELPVDCFMAFWCHLIEDGFLHEGCAASAKAAKRPLFECQDVSKILPELKADVFIFQNQFDQYQANDLGLCPPSLCNATTSPGSRAWQYLEVLGNRSNETMEKAIAARPDMAVFAPSWFDHTIELERNVAGQGVGIHGRSFADAFGSWLAGEQVHLFAAACHGGPCPLKPQDELAANLV